MINSIMQRSELFVLNRDNIKRNFRWDNTLIHPLCASLYTEHGYDVDWGAIKNSRDIIKKQTGVFSNFRGSVQLVYATMLSLEKNPENKIDKVLKAYGNLKNEFFTSQYLPLSAFIMADMVEEVEYDRITKKAKDIYRRMKKEHPFLTSNEDAGFAVMFAISDLSVDKAIEEMETCYQILKDSLFSKNAVQSISHVLALGEENGKEKCKRVVDIYQGLRDRGYKYGTRSELAVLGVLALETNDVKQVVSDIIKVDDYLIGHKGFGIMGIGRPQRMMYAAIIVMQEYKKDRINSSDNIMNLTSINSITSVIIAQQIAVSAAIAASVSSSSNSS